MSAVSDETWARLRQQVEAAQGETMLSVEKRAKREFRAAVEATGWDGARCRVDPHKAYSADPIHTYRILNFWRALVRNEFAVHGDIYMKAEPQLTWAFNEGCAPWDARVTRILAEAGGQPVWTRRALRVQVAQMKRLLAAAA